MDGLQVFSFLFIRKELSLLHVTLLALHVKTFSNVHFKMNVAVQCNQQHQSFPLYFALLPAPECSSFEGQSYLEQFGGQFKALHCKALY